jgi:hypothetical protein
MMKDLSVAVILALLPQLGHCEAIPVEIVVFYASGHFAPSLWRVNAKVIVYNQGGQENPGPRVGRSSATLLGNLYKSLYFLRQELQPLSPEALAQLEKRGGAGVADYVLVLKFAEGRAQHVTIHHGDTVRTGERVGKHLEFGELIRDFQCLAWYLREEELPIKSLPAEGDTLPATQHESAVPK